jgi:L-cysteate sulfo-lyase
MINLKKFHHKSLGFFPTPITELSNFSRKLGGPRILIKRDDLTGLALGGNKTRKLEFLIGDAISHSCDTIITGGAEQSNHCRQTAAAAAACGLECHLVLGGKEPKELQGNILLDRILGANIHWTGEYRKGEKIPEIVENLISAGRKPYVIPYGGSNEIGSLGFVNAVDELNIQIKEKNLAISDIVFASSSGGTQAGLVVGRAITKSSYNIIGIEIDKGETGDILFRSYIKTIIQKASQLLEIEIQNLDSEIVLKNEYIGEGYAVVGDLEREAIDLLAQTEGIIVDPVYTGRALGGLIDMIRSKQFTSKDCVLFWHTGGTPAVFSYSQKLCKNG